MHMEPKELRALQMALLEIIKEIDRVCKKNGIEYTLDGGTLLGAVRGHDFIPWDDDADIAFSREEYEKFVVACEKDLNKEKFFLQEYRTDPDYPWGYSKMRMNNTEMIRKKQEHLKCHSGIYVDIFPYDQVPDGFFSRRLHHFACYCLRKCQYAVMGKLYAPSAFMRGWYKLLDRIPKKWVFAQLEKLVRKTNKVKSTLASHKTYPYFRKECHYGLPSKCFDEYMDTEFSGGTFRIMKDYDSYLTALYGDYMTPPTGMDNIDHPFVKLTLPPEEEQK